MSWHRILQALATVIVGVMVINLIEPSNALSMALSVAFGFAVATWFRRKEKP